MKTKIQVALKEALKSKDKVRLETLRAIKSAIQYEEMSKAVDNLKDSEIIAVIRTHQKKLQEELAFAQQANRSELVENLDKELAVVDEFLPVQLNEEQLKTIILNLVHHNPNATLGELMKSLREGYVGQYDGKQASEVAKEILSS
ncbi:MAG: GatB/YqeY domain-containing protein [Bdellovibrionales bacterium]|nr:GatB/YqeY domain-containing protein [Bdellovibrionales bacterium]